MLSSKKALLACPPFSQWNLPSFTVESILSSPCSRSDAPLSRQGAAFSDLMTGYFGKTALFVLARAAPAF